MNHKTRRLALLAIFFFSGSAGLVYEVVWARQLSITLGVSVYAVTAVLVAFMGGLGLGAEFFGRALDKGASPIRLYSTLEVCLGVYALVFPHFIGMMQSVYVVVHGGAQGITPGIIVLRFVMAVSVMLVPTILMGGTLPAMVRHFADERSRGYGGLAGSLYALNTLGAVVGCLAAGFMMIESLGLNGAMRVGAVVNITGGVLAWLAAREPGWRTQYVAKPARKAGRGRQPKKRDTALLAAYGVTGFCALALEVVWTRLLILQLNNTTYAFTLILAAILLGIGVGSAVTSHAAKKWSGNALELFAIFQLGVGILALWSFLMFSGEWSWLDGQAPGRMVFSALFSVLIVTPCALLLGGSFPLALEMLHPDAEGISGDVGRLYAVNICGGVLGSIIAGYWFIPLLGVSHSLLVVAWLSVALGLWLVMVKARKSSVLFTVLFWVVVPFASYMVYSQDVAFRISAKKLDAGSDVIFYREGPSATVLVSSRPTDQSVGRKPIKRLWINGDPIAGSFREALQLERLQAHIPLLLRPGARDALVICFGTGSTAGAVLTHGVSTVTAVDISGEVFAAGHQFREGNLDVMRSPRLKMVEEDGRNFLLTTRRRFDFITAEPPPPSNAGVVSLYTKEFYQLCRKRLNPGGVVTQWIPLHHLSEKDFKSLVAAFLEVFPASQMWYTKWDAIMIGADHEIPLDISAIRKGMQTPAVADSLAGIGIKNALQLASNYMMGRDELVKYVSGVTAVTDDRPVVEFSAPRVHSIGVAIKGPNLAGILKLRRPPAVGPSDDTASRLENFFDSQTIFFKGQIARSDGKKAKAASLYKQALEINKENTDARYAYLALNLETLYSALARGKPQLAVEMLKRTETMDVDGLYTPQIRFLRGMYLAMMDRTQDAEREFKEAIRLDKNYFMAVVSLAGLYKSRLNRPAKARELYTMALDLNPSESERSAILSALENSAL